MVGLQLAITGVADYTSRCEVNLATNPDHLTASNCVLVADVYGPVPAVVGPGMGLLQFAVSTLKVQSEAYAEDRQLLVFGFSFASGCSATDDDR